MDVLEAVTQDNLKYLKKVQETRPFVWNDNVRDNKGHYVTTPLVKACECNSTTILDWLIDECHVDVNKMASPGTTPLYTACERGNISLVKYLIDKDANVNHHVKLNKLTPLHISIKAGYFDIVKELIKSGANVNLMSNHGTPLLEAAQQSSMQCVKLLLDNGADINKTSPKTNETALHKSAELEYISLMRFLVQNGADITIRLNDREYTPLHVAAANRKNASIEYLLNQAGVEVESVAGGKTALIIATAMENVEGMKMLISRGADVNYLPETKGTANDTEPTLTPLMVAAYHGIKRAMELLLSKGAKPNLRNQFGNTALHYVLFESGEAGSDKDEAKKLMLGKLLLRYKASSTIQNNLHVTPFYYALRRRFLSILDLFLANGASPNEPDENESTVFHHSAGNPDVYSLLAKYRADPNLPDINGYTGLHIAAASYKTKAEDLQRLLVDFGAEVTQSHDGEFPYHMAKRLDVINLFLKQGCDIEMKTVKGDTTLHCAVKNRLTANEVRKLLKLKNFDVDLKNEDGVSSTDLARLLSNSDLLKALEETKHEKEPGKSSPKKTNKESATKKTTKTNSPSKKNDPKPISNEVKKKTKRTSHGYMAPTSNQTSRLQDNKNDKTKNSKGGGQKPLNSQRNKENGTQEQKKTKDKDTKKKKDQKTAENRMEVNVLVLHHEDEEDAYKQQYEENDDGDNDNNANEFLDLQFQRTDNLSVVQEEDTTMLDKTPSPTRYATSTSSSTKVMSPTGDYREEHAESARLKGILKHESMDDHDHDDETASKNSRSCSFVEDVIVIESTEHAKDLKEQEPVDDDDVEDEKYPEGSRSSPSDDRVTVQPLHDADDEQKKHDPADTNNKEIPNGSLPDDVNFGQPHSEDADLSKEITEAERRCSSQDSQSLSSADYDKAYMDGMMADGRSQFNPFYESPASLDDEILYNGYGEYGEGSTATPSDTDSINNQMGEEYLQDQKSNDLDGNEDKKEDHFANEQNISKEYTKFHDINQEEDEDPNENKQKTSEVESKSVEKNFATNIDQEEDEDLNENKQKTTEVESNSVEKNSATDEKTKAKKVTKTTTTTKNNASNSKETTKKPNKTTLKKETKSNGKTKSDTLKSVNQRKLALKKTSSTDANEKKPTLKKTASVEANQNKPTLKKKTSIETNEKKPILKKKTSMEAKGSSAKRSDNSQVDQQISHDVLCDIVVLFHQEASQKADQISEYLKRRGRAFVTKQPQGEQDDSKKDESEKEQFKSKIKQAKMVVMLITETFKTSEECLSYCKYADRYHKLIYPLKLEKCHEYQTTSLLDLMVGGKYHFEVGHHYEQEMNKLLQKIKDKLHV